MFQVEKEFICECGKQFTNSQSFNGHKSNCKIHLITKYGNDEYYNQRYNKSKESLRKATATFVNNKKCEQQNKLQLWLSEKHTCESCGKVMTEKYGSGRFCCSFCAHSRKCLDETKEKISTSLIAFYDTGKKKTVKPAYSYNNPRVGLIDALSDEQVIQFFNEAENMKDFIIKLGYSENFSTVSAKVKDRCKQLGLDLELIKRKAIPLKDILSNKVTYSTSNLLKIRLVKEGYKEDKCECCGQGPEWFGKRLPLELHHVDGNRENNSLENLKILCPNCHSLTDTFRSKNRKKK